MNALKVLLPADFTDAHRRLALAYIMRGHAFNREEWRQAITAFDLLKDAAVLTPTGVLPFPIIYRREVEARYAHGFIKALLQTEKHAQANTARWAAVARRIAPDLEQTGLYGREIPATRFLLAYCLYWWRSFTLGYALEIEIQRDLRAAKIQFKAHDLLNSKARLSPYDLIVSGFKGDIKTSLYFLQAARSRLLAHDFYITRVYGRARVRTLVVFLQPVVWETIDGETLVVLLSEIADTLPEVMRIVHEGRELVVVDYAIWKQKIRQYQTGVDDG